MLAHVADTLRERRDIRVGFGDGDSQDGGAIVLDENCTVSRIPIRSTQIKFLSLTMLLQLM